MKKSLLFLGLAFLCNSMVAQNTKTWAGPNNGVWSDGNNWLPIGMPVFSDTVIFNSLNTCELDISPVIASLRATGVGGSLASSLATRSMTINNHGALSPVFNVSAGATFSIGNGGLFDILFSTYDPGGGVPNNAVVDGTLVLGLASGWVINDAAVLHKTDTYISGAINIAASHTGTVFYNSSSGTVRFLSGASLVWARDGGAIPAADYQDGSVINITGIANAMVSLGTGTNYSGTVIWNSPNQAAGLTGATAVLLPSATYPMDSIRVVNTGLGTLRLATDPSGYSIGHLEVQGGILEMSSPVASNKTGTIATDLKISGGTVFVNSTYAGEVAGSSYSMALTVNGNIIVTGGTLNLTSRPMPSTYGAGQVYVYGNVIQTGGTITASSLFSAQNYISMDGGPVQNLQLDNITGQINLVITNGTGGVNLLNSIILPRAFSLIGGYITLNNFDISAPAPLFNAIANGKIVTNGTGAITITGLVANTSRVLPVAISSTTFNPVTITAQSGGAASNDYSVRVAPGNLPSGIYNSSRTINRTWYISSATNITSGTVDLSFQYIAADANSFCIPSANMELGHFIPGLPGAWNIDPSGNLLPGGTGPYVAGPYAPNSLGSSFVVGNVGAILAVNNGIKLEATKQNNKAHLSWHISNTTSLKSVELERSADGSNFSQLAIVTTGMQSLVDDKLLPGLNYYRIKIIYLNGAIAYSAKVAVLNKASGFHIVGLTPNVVNNNTVLNIAAAQKGKMELQVTDVTGKLVQKNTINLFEGSNQVALDFSRLSAGVYLLRVFGTKDTLNMLRFIKQ